MKKIVIGLLVCAFIVPALGGCKKNMKDEGKFKGVLSGWEVNLKDPMGTYKDFVLDEQTAYEIGNAILKRVYGEEKLKNTRFIVYEVEGKDYFVVCRGPKAGPGGGYNVALNKEDGKILRIWACE